MYSDAPRSRKGGFGPDLKPDTPATNPPIHASLGSKNVGLMPALSHSSRCRSAFEKLVKYFVGCVCFASHLPWLSLAVAPERHSD